MQNYPLVLAVQDTSFLNYTSHPKTKGLGPIGAKEQNLLGLVMHTTMTLTPAGLPLGILGQNIWDRDAEADSTTPAELRKRPIEEKESQSGCNRCSKQPI